MIMWYLAVPHSWAKYESNMGNSWFHRCTVPCIIHGGRLCDGIDDASDLHFRQLSDVDRDGALSLEEFCIAMHLVVLRRNDIELPANLPPALIPYVPLVNVNPGKSITLCSVTFCQIIILCEWYDKETWIFYLITDVKNEVDFPYHSSKWNVPHQPA